MQYDGIPFTADQENTALIIASDNDYLISEGSSESEIEQIHCREDTHGIEEVAIKLDQKVEKDDYELSPDFNKQNLTFLKSTFENRSLIRNVILVGPHFHGKTTLFNYLLVEARSDIFSEPYELTSSVDSVRFKKPPQKSNTDSEKRIYTVHSSLLTTVLSSSAGLCALNLFDCPGHIEFLSELEDKVQLVDDAILVVSAIMGPDRGLESQLRVLFLSGISPSLLVLTHIDRMIYEQVLPPNSFCEKIEWVISAVNSVVQTVARDYNFQTTVFNPSKENVIFAAVPLNLALTVRDFLQLYDRYRSFSPKHSLYQNKYSELTAVSWGPFGIQSNENKTEIIRIDKMNIDLALDNEVKSIFQNYIVEPLYALLLEPVALDFPDLKHWLSRFKISIKENQFDSVSELLRWIYSVLLPANLALAYSIKRCCRQPISRNNTEEHQIFCKTLLFRPTVRHDPNEFYVRITASELSITNELCLTDDMKLKIKNLSLAIGNRKISISSLAYGQIAIIELDSQNSRQFKSYLRALNRRRADSNSVSDTIVPKNLSTSLFAADVTGYHTISQSLYNMSLVNKFCDFTENPDSSFELRYPGETAGDTALFELRNVFADVEIVTSLPNVNYYESVDTPTYVLEQSNELSCVTIMLKPLPTRILRLFELKKLHASLSPEQLREMLAKYPELDLLERNGLIAASSPMHSCLLINAVVPPLEQIENQDFEESWLWSTSLQSDRSSLFRSSDVFVDGFQHALNAGPLFKAPIFGVLVAITHFNSKEANIPKAKLRYGFSRSIHNAIIRSSPTLFEPIQIIDVILPTRALKSIRNILNERRGHVLKMIYIYATNYVRLIGKIPLSEITGCEVEFRMKAGGESRSQHQFYKLERCPGVIDINNKSYQILHRVPDQFLAQDIFHKMRVQREIS